MIEYLGRVGSARWDRLVLFGCACCRRGWHRLEGREYEAVGAVEDWLEERVYERKLRRLREHIRTSGQVATLAVQHLNPAPTTIAILALLEAALRREGGDTVPFI